MLIISQDGTYRQVSEGDFMGAINENDPQMIKAEIFELAEEYLYDFIDGKFTGPDKSKLLKLGMSCKNIVFFTRANKVLQDGKEKIILKGYAGSPLYIALKLKYYEEAEAILDKNPDAAFTGYAALPVVLTYPNETTTPQYRQAGEEVPDFPDYFDFPELKYLVDKGIYLQELTYTDKEIPDNLFLKLCNALSKRDKSKVDKPLTLLREKPELPVFLLKGSKNKDSCDNNDAPILALDFPDKFHGITTKPNQSYMEKALANLQCYVDFLDGLYRLKKLDADLFNKIFNETAAYWVFIQYYQKMICVIIEIAKEEDILDNEVDDFHITDIKGDIDIEEEFEKVRKKFKRLGINKLSADVLWDTMESVNKIAEITPVGRYNVNSYVLYDVYKAVFKDKLIFEFDCDGFNTKDLNKLSKILGLSTDATCNYYWRDYDAKIHNIAWNVDRINWVNENAIKTGRKMMEKAVIQMKDKEFFLACLEKNIFPIWDAEFMVECIGSESEEYREYLPLVLLKKHGRFD